MPLDSIYLYLGMSPIILTDLTRDFSRGYHAPYSGLLIRSP